MAQDPYEQANIRRAVIALGVLLALGGAMWLFRRAAGIPWTGFGTRTLWDWLQLLAALLIPVAVAFVGYTYTRRQAEREYRTTLDNQRETALQTYLDRMTELLLKEKLLESEEGATVRVTARSRTLTVLRSLDGHRKAAVLQFLYESELIHNDKRIVDLDGADFHGAPLRFANLYRANLRGTNLSGAELTLANLRGTNLHWAKLSRANLPGARLIEADLSHAYFNRANLHRARLIEADLSNADLSHADLSGAIPGKAILREANLSGAIVTQEQLTICRTLRGTTLPDGTKVPDDQDFPEGWK